MANSCSSIAEDDLMGISTQGLLPKNAVSSVPDYDRFDMFDEFLSL